MLKNISKLEFQVGEKSYQFLCESDSPIDHAKMALVEFLKFLQSIEESNQKKSESQNPENESEAQ